MALYLSLLLRIGLMQRSSPSRKSPQFRKGKEQEILTGIPSSQFAASKKFPASLADPFMALQSFLTLSVVMSASDPTISLFRGALYQSE